MLACVVVRLRKPPAVQHGGCDVDVVLVVEVAVVEDVDDDDVEVVGTGGVVLVVDVGTLSAGPQTRYGFGPAIERAANWSWTSSDGGAAFVVHLIL